MLFRSHYEVVDSQVEVPAGADQRRGIQPVVQLKANGSVRADVAVNQPVTFTATIEVPPQAGKVIAAEWDFEGVGNYPVAERLDAPQVLVRLSATHSFSKPGTYFSVLRATAQRQGDMKTPYARIHNIARVRVVVNWVPCNRLPYLPASLFCPLPRECVIKILLDQRVLAFDNGVHLYSAGLHQFPGARQMQLRRARPAPTGA